MNKLTPEEIRREIHNELEGQVSDSIIEEFIKVNKSLLNRLCKAQLAKVQKADRPELRKLLNGILDQPMDGIYEVGSKVYLHQHEKTFWLDQIITLMPDVEEAKREERERTLSDIKTNSFTEYGAEGTLPLHQVMKYKYWQALQELPK